MGVRYVDTLRTILVTFPYVKTTLKFEKFHKVNRATKKIKTIKNKTKLKVSMNTMGRIAIV